MYRPRTSDDESDGELRYTDTDDGDEVSEEESSDSIEEDSSSEEETSGSEESEESESEGGSSNNKNPENDFNSSRLGSPDFPTSFNDEPVLQAIKKRLGSDASSEGESSTSGAEYDIEAEIDGEEKTLNGKVSWNCSPAKQASLITTFVPVPVATLAPGEKVIKTPRLSRPASSENKDKTKAGNDAVYKNANLNQLSELATLLEAKKKRKRKPRPVTICLTHCRYEIVKSVASSFGLKSVSETDNWNIYWTDFSVSLDRAMDLKRFQTVNHFPGMNEICRKDLLARNLNRMKKLFHKDYDIFPRTWSLPADLGDLQMFHATHKNKTYICKPEMGCQGRGIFLVRNVRDLNPFGKIICQLYLQKPFLIDDLKFDLRIYVLLTSCDPLRIYFYNEGLARFATAKYKLPTNHNTENSYMHLTNYAVNKYSRDFVPDDAVNGSKRKYTAVLQWLKERKYDTKAIEAQIEDVIIKTIITAQPILKHNYRTCFPNHDVCTACFEILGFDIILDMNLKPYVLEVNHSPSFHTDSQIDTEIKENLLRDTFAMFNLKLLDRRKIQGEDRKRVIERLVPPVSEKKEPERETSASKTPSARKEKKRANWEMESTGGYRLIYPSETSEIYDQFFDQNLGSIYQSTQASQARVTLIRSQIEEYNTKKLDEEKKRLVVTGGPASRAKDSTSSTKEAADRDLKSRVPGNKFPLPANVVGDSFKVQHIIAEEELDRLKGLMQRGIMIRSMGVEVHVYKLLSDMGCIKPKDEKLFKRLHGFTNHFKMKAASDMRIDIRAPNQSVLAPLPTPEQTQLVTASQSQVTSELHSPRTNDTVSSVVSSTEESSLMSQITRDDFKRSLDSYNIALHYTSSGSDINGNYGNNYRYNPYGPRAANIFPDTNIKFSGPSIKNLSLGGTDSHSYSGFPSQMKISQHRSQNHLSQMNGHIQYASGQNFFPKRISEVHRSYEHRRGLLTTETYNNGYAINVAPSRVMASAGLPDANSSDRFNTSGTGDQLEAKRSGVNFARPSGLQQKVPATAVYSPTQWSTAERGYYYPNTGTQAAFQNTNSISSLRAPYLAAEVRQNLNNAFGDDEFSQQYAKGKPSGNIQSGRLTGRNSADKSASISGMEEAGIVLPRKPKSKRLSVIQSHMIPKSSGTPDMQGPMRVTQMFFDSKGLAQPRKPFTARPVTTQSKSARSYNLLSAEIIPGRLKAEIQTGKNTIPLVSGRRIITNTSRSEKIIYTNNTDANLRLLHKGHTLMASSKMSN